MTVVDERPTIQPVAIGPTWQKDPDGKWLLPERTLGWQILGWTATNLQHPDGKPFRLTNEQARFLLWWYAIDCNGRFLYRDGVLQRIKGWGKDPLAAVMSAVEFVGPCRFGGWLPDGSPWAVPNPSSWVQIAAVSKDQTRNTMTLFPSMFTKECIAEHSIDLGKEVIYAYKGARRIEAVTSSPRALEGGRPTFTIANETHHWLSNNEGHEMWAVIERNATKSADGASRTLAITNAYEPSEDSVAQRTREAWEAARAGTHADTGLLYDSLEAPPSATLDVEALPAVLAAVRGDSVWLDIPRIIQSVLDRRNPESRSRRFWLNQITAAEDSWIDPDQFDLCAKPEIEVAAKDEIVLFFDGSKSDDATALVGCRVVDGHVITFGLWQRPPAKRADDWTAPRQEIDRRVDQVHEEHNVIAFFADPSHTKDDVTQERYWDDIIDGWHQRYRSRYRVWAVPGNRGHSVMWDMTSPGRSQEFTAAAERCSGDIETQRLSHDGDRRLVIHTRNAKRFPNRWGVSLWKGHRESPRKVDLAVAMVGARMVRRLVLNAGNESKDKRAAGEVWGWRR